MPGGQHEILITKQWEEVCCATASMKWLAKARLVAMLLQSVALVFNSDELSWSSSVLVALFNLRNRC